MYDFYGDYQRLKDRIRYRIVSGSHGASDEEVEKWLEENGIEAAIAEHDDGNFCCTYRELKEQLAYKIVSDARGASEEAVEAWIEENGIEAAITLVEG